jgi:hypothetical protein
MEGIAIRKRCIEPETSLTGYCQPYFVTAENRRTQPGNSVGVAYLLESGGEVHIVNYSDCPQFRTFPSLAFGTGRSDCPENSNAGQPIACQ